jgi:hypothetical protein
MPKELKKSIDFFHAYRITGEEPVRDTIRDTIREARDTLPQDTTDLQAPATDTLSGEQLTTPDSLQEATDAASTNDTLQPATQQAETPEAADTTTTTTTGQPAQTTPDRPETRQPAAQPPAREAAADQQPTSLHDIFGFTEMPIKPRLEKDPAHHNFLYNIPAVKPQDSLAVGDIYRPTDDTPREFTEQQVKTGKEITIQSTRPQGHDWITFVLVASLLLIGWTRLFYKKYFISLVQSFHFYNYASSLFWGKNSLTQRASVLLNLNFFMAGGMVAFQSLNQFSHNPSGISPIQVWLLFAAFLMAWYSWNYLMTGFVGFVFLRQRVFSEYLHNYNLYRKMAGIALFPIAVVVQFIHEPYRPYFLIAGGIIFGIIFLVHIIRGFQVFAKENVSIFYLFLYLCALEFLPIVLVFELFIRQLTS